MMSSRIRQLRALFAPGPGEEPEEEPVDLVARLALAALPPAAAVAVAEPEPEVAPLPAPPPEPAELERVVRRYEVVETVGDRSSVRHVAASLLSATDVAFDLVERGSQRAQVEVVLVKGGLRETVLSFCRELPANTTVVGDSLLDLYGYPVTRWRGPEHLK
jgi:hypothetical protein